MMIMQESLVAVSITYMPHGVNKYASRLRLGRDDAREPNRVTENVNGLLYRGFLYVPWRVRSSVEGLAPTFN